MRHIVHLSDLHFDRIDETLIAPLIRCIEALQPHLLVVSGDLTQRARTEQFKQARAFLQRLPEPQLVVPGNHDISLHNLFSRFVQPLAKYRRYISDNLLPAFTDDEIAVVGINTARSLTVKDGRINQDQIAHLRARLGSHPAKVVKIVVSHHPFDLPGLADDDERVGRATLAMTTLRECKADLLLSGHFHTSHASPLSTKYDNGDYAALVVQAGTATSTRGRGETNSFNFLRIETDRITVERFGWQPEQSEFLLARSESFARVDRGWHRLAL